MLIEFATIFVVCLYSNFSRVVFVNCCQSSPSLSLFHCGCCLFSQVLVRLLRFQVVSVCLYPSSVVLCLGWDEIVNRVSLFR